MADKKKILHIVEAMGGGIFTYIVELANELVNFYDVYIAYAVREQTPKDYKEYFDERIKLIEVRNFDREIKVRKDIAAFFEIKKIANMINPDIIHLHSSKAGVLGRIAFNSKKRAVFYTPHGYSFLMENVGTLKQKTYKMVELICGKRRSVTISCSLGEQKESKKLTKIALYINNGINIEKINNLIRRSKSNIEHPYTVFTLGRICYQKDPILFNSIAEAMPEVQFLWIGDGELRDKLTSKNIEITGWLDRATAIKYAVNADVFLLTSKWEGLPIALLESMYMRKPCIVSDVIGNRDVIQRGKNGFVCSEIDEYVKAILDCKGKIKNDFVEQAYRDILEKYNTKIMAEKYMKIYEKYLNELRYKVRR